MIRSLLCAAGCAALGLAAPAASLAEIAVVSNDAHTVLDDGKQVAPKNALADTVAIVDLAQYPPKITGTVEAPGSVVGPPMAVAVAPDESWAVVTSATKADPSGSGGIGPDDRVSVIDLTSKPPRVMQSLTAGAGATTVRFTPDMKLALIANRAEGTVSLFGIDGKTLTPAGKLDLGNPKAGPSGLAVLPDGRSALLSRDGDSMVSVLHIEGTTVTVDPRPITAGMKPYTLDVNAAGTLAAVSNMGRGDGDADSVSLIDLTKQPFRTVAFITVPSGPEGLKFSPDGHFLAVGSQNGTTKPAASTFLGTRGRFMLFALEDQAPRLVAEAPIGGWNQGIAFSRDGKTILVESMTGRDLSVFRWENGVLTKGDDLPLGAGAAAVRTAWP